MAAREELMPLFADVVRHVKHDGSMVTEADVAMQQRLKSDLARHWPEYDFLGEEMTGHEHEQLTAGGQGLWCVDPLDGTSNFATGIPYFAVSLALLIDGQQELGLVYDPVRDECFMARRGKGAWLNDMALGAHEPPPPDALRRCMASVDFKRLQRAAGRATGGVAALRFAAQFRRQQPRMVLARGRPLPSLSARRAEAVGLRRRQPDPGRGRRHGLHARGRKVFSYGLKPRSVVAAATPALFSDWKTWIDANWKPVAMIVLPLTE